jgi:hypothetical protein
MEGAESFSEFNSPQKVGDGKRQAVLRIGIGRLVGREPVRERDSM